MRRCKLVPAIRLAFVALVQVSFTVPVPDSAIVDAGQVYSMGFRLAYTIVTFPLDYTLFMHDLIR